MLVTNNKQKGNRNKQLVTHQRCYYFKVNDIQLTTQYLFLKDMEITLKIVYFIFFQNKCVQKIKKKYIGKEAKMPSQFFNFTRSKKKKTNLFNS